MCVVTFLCICMCFVYEQTVEDMLEPNEGITRAAVIKFGSPDIAPALDVKKYYCQLAETLQVQHRVHNTQNPQRTTPIPYTGRSEGLR